MLSKAKAVCELCVHGPKKDAVSNSSFFFFFFFRVSLSFSLTKPLISDGSKQMRLSPLVPVIIKSLN